MKKNINFAVIIYILSVYLSLSTDRQKIYNVQYMSKYYIGIIITIILFLLLIIRDKNSIKINKKQLYIAKIMFLPILLIYIYTLSIFFYKSLEYSGLISRSLGIVMYFLLAIIQAYIIFSYFGTNAINYTFFAIVLSYLTSMIVAFKENGLQQFISIITDSSYSGSVLEMHELAPIVGMLIFYYIYLLYLKKISIKKGIVNFIICLVILILSMKRIVILTTSITFVLFFFFKRNRKKFLNIVGIVSISLIILSYIYIYSIKSGYLYIILNTYNINSMSRYQIWSGISNQYNFSLLYLGKGLGFTSIWMDNNWQYLKINGLTQSTGLHNDILKFYIDLGFVISGLYLFNLLYINTKKIYYKINKNLAMLYFLLIISQILTWFTDVVSGYHNYQWIFFLIIFSLLSYKEKE